MTAQVNATICVSPLSPNYLLFHRYVYYISLLLPLLYVSGTSSSQDHPSITTPPLIKASYAYALTYSGTASLYAILLLASPLSLDSQPINLDIFAVWTVLSSAGIALLIFLEWDPILQDDKSGKKARPIFRIWGVWIAIGAVCILVALVKINPGAGDLMASDTTQQSTCLALSQYQQLRFRLRASDDVVVRNYDRILGASYGRLTHTAAPLAFVVLFFGFISSVVTVWPAGEKDKPSTYACFCVSSDSEEFSLVSAIRSGYLQARWGALVCAPVFFVATVVLNENYLLKGWQGDDGMPSEEKTYEIGQWGLIVSMSLVTAAALVNWIIGRIWRKAQESGIVCEM